MAEILASVEDINGNLPSQDRAAVIEATPENGALVQVSVARVVRGYLSGAIDGVILMGWNSPDNTPDIVREAAAKLIAAQIYFNFAARSSLTIEDNNFAQKLYDQAIIILDKILSGEIIIGDEVPVATESMTDEDFWPVDDTDRAFTMSMEL